MKTFPLRLYSFRVLVVALASLAAPLAAQQLDNPVYYDVSFRPTLYVQGGTSGGYTVAFVDESGVEQTVSVGGSSPVDGNTVNVKLLPNKDYTVTVSGSGFHAGRVTFTVPGVSAATAFVDGARRPYSDFLAEGVLDFEHTFNVRVGVAGNYPLENAPDNLRAGSASSLVADKPIWYVGLGKTRGGQPAGALGFRQKEFSVAGFFTPSILYCDPLDATEVDVKRLAGAMRQVLSREVLIDVQASTSTSYTLSVYPRSQVGGLSGGFYTFSGTPFIVYTVEQILNGGNPSGVKITRVEDSIAWETSLELNIGTTTWTRKDWHRPAASASIVTTTYSSATSATVTHTGPASGLSGDTALSWTKSFTNIPATGTNELGSTVMGGTETTAYAYHLVTGPETYAGQLKSQTDPSGGWVKYDYYHQNSGTGNAGAIKRMFRPWLDGPASPDTATTANSVCTEYTYDPTYFFWPASVITTAPGGTLSKTTWTYSTASSLNNHAVISSVKSSWPDSNAAHALVTTTKTFRPDVSVPYFRSLPVSVAYPEGRKESYAYFNGTWNASAKTFGGSAAGEDRMVLVFRGQTTGGSAVNSWTSGSVTWNMDPVNMEAGRSTVSAAVIDTTGRQVFTGEYVYTTSGTLALVSGTSYTYDSHGRLVAETDANRPAVSTAYAYTVSSGTHPFSVTVTASDGVVTRSDYDERMRLVQTITGIGGGSTAPQTIKQTVYDAANRPVADYACNCGTAPTRYFYDAASRLSSKREMSPNDSPSASQGSLLTSYNYSVARQVTTTLPTGATRTEATYRDGRFKSVTGTAQPPAFADYVLNGTGLKVTSYNSASSDKTYGWSEDQSDWLGRPVTNSVPSWGWNSGGGASKIIDTTHTYHPNGTLAKTAVTNRAAGNAEVAPATLYVYDAAGRVIMTGADVNANGTLEAASNDRIATTSRYFEDAGGWFAVVETGTYAVAGSGTPTLVGKTRTRLTGFGSNEVGQVVSIDANGRTTTQTSTVNPSQKTATSQLQVQGLSNVAFESSKNGYDYETQTFSGERVLKEYDARGRLSAVKSRWSGTAYAATDTYAYFGDTGFLQTLNQAGVPVQHTYAWGSGTRTVSRTDAAGTAYVVYDAMDLPWRTYGAGASPTQKTYDGRARLTGLTTWRSGSFDGATWPSSPGTGDTTTWASDNATGLTNAKTYAGGAQIGYTYTPLGQPKTRTGARGLVTTYDYYDGTGTTTSDISHRTQELKAVTYSDSTPSVSHTYTRAGLPAGVSDVTGARTFSYAPGNPLQLQKETFGTFYNNGATARVRSFVYDGVGRGTGFKLGTAADDDADLSQTVAYVATSGLLNYLDSASGGGAARRFTYGYEASSGLVDNYATGSFTASYDYDATSAARRTKVEGAWSGTARTRFDLAYDNRGFVKTAKQSGTAFADYYTGTSYGSVYDAHAYDARGQLQTTAKYRGTPGAGTPPSADELPGRRFEYRYDAMGNRTSAGATGSAGGGDDEYVPNARNQYVTKENNSLKVLGTAAAGANVGAQSSSGGALVVNKKDRSFAADVLPLNNASGPAQGTATIYGALVGAGSGGSDLLGSTTRPWQIAQQLQSFSYDLDGNLTGDGVWTYQYDAENRLIRMESTSAAVSAGLPNQVLEFKYDFMGRRVQKRSNNVTAGTNAYTRYVYDGWNVVAEFNAPGGTSCGAMLRSFTWGLDLASGASTGGVGALLQIVDHGPGKTYFPTYDGNGNVVALIDPDNSGMPAAIYEYSPFGELLRTEGAYAAANPFRFSTKWTDTESGLSYYGYRYYSATLGRFINRDPIEEQGGLNLYAFVGNNPVNGIDFLGLFVKVCFDLDLGECQFPYGCTVDIREICFWVEGGDENLTRIEIPGLPPIVITGSGGTPSPQAPDKAPNNKERCAELRRALQDAKLSRAAYGDAPPPGAFQPVGEPFTDPSGFRAMLFENANTGARVLAYAGTDDWADVKTDAANAIGLQTQQLQLAVSTANYVISVYGSANLSFTGHSLGGLEGATASMATGIPSRTFNAAGPVVSDGFRASAAGSVTNYHVTGEIVTAAQNAVGFNRALGTQVEVAPADGRLKYVPGLLGRAWRSGDRHTIGSTIDALEQKILNECH